MKTLHIPNTFYIFLQINIGDEDRYLPPPYEIRVKSTRVGISSNIRMLFTKPRIRLSCNKNVPYVNLVEAVVHFSDNFKIVHGATTMGHLWQRCSLIPGPQRHMPYTRIIGAQIGRRCPVAFSHGWFINMRRARVKKSMTILGTFQIGP